VFSALMSLAGMLCLPHVPGREGAILLLPHVEVPLQAVPPAWCGQPVQSSTAHLLHNFM